MNAVDNFGTSFVSNMEGLWQGLVNIALPIVFSIILLVIGWIVAIVLGRLATPILRAFRVDQIAERMGAKKGLEKAGYKLDIAELFGDLVKWFFILTAVMGAADAIGLSGVSGFLSGQVLPYIPNVAMAVVILLAGLLLANFLSKLVKGSVTLAGLASPDMLAAITRWSVMVFAFLIALEQLGVGQIVIGTLINGLVAMLAIAGGLAFGLGGREAAADFIKKIRNEIRN